MFKAGVVVTTPIYRHRSNDVTLLLPPPAYACKKEMTGVLKKIFLSF